MFCLQSCYDCVAIRTGAWHYTLRAPVSTRWLTSIGQSQLISQVLFLCLCKHFLSVPRFFNLFRGSLHQILQKLKTMFWRLFRCLLDQFSPHGSRRTSLLFIRIASDPLILQYFCSRNTVFCLDCQHACDKCRCLSGYTLHFWIVAHHYLFVQLFVSLTFEWEYACQHNVE